MKIELLLTLGLGSFRLIWKKSYSSRISFLCDVERTFFFLLAAIFFICPRWIKRTTNWISRDPPNHSFCVPIKLSLWNSHQIKIFAQQERIRSQIMEKWPLRGSNGGSKGVKMGSWGSNLIWALIFTKFGGKERFCKLLNNLSLDLHFFYFESPVWPPEGVKWESNGGQILFELWSSPNLVGRSIFASC